MPYLPTHSRGSQLPEASINCCFFLSQQMHTCVQSAGQVLQGPREKKNMSLLQEFVILQDGLCAIPTAVPTSDSGLWDVIHSTVKHVSPECDSTSANKPRNLLHPWRTAWKSGTATQTPEEMNRLSVYLLSSGHCPKLISNLQNHF